MRKDDIIGQKLFETCKLSEFYLKLVVDSKDEDESPLELARAYKQKLNEICDRYDRLLDANKQKEQLSLSFDTQQHQQQLAKSQSDLNKMKSKSSTTTPLVSTPSLINLTRSSTPNKLGAPLTPNGIGVYSNIHASQNATATTSTSSSYASTPTTPMQPNSKVSFSSYNQHRNIYSTHQRSNSSRNNSSSSKSKFNQNGHHSTYSNKLLQQFAYIYNDEDDDEDDGNSNGDYENVDENDNIDEFENEVNFNNTYYNNQSVLYLNSSSNSSSDAKPSVPINCSTIIKSKIERPNVLNTNSNFFGPKLNCRLDYDENDYSSNKSLKDNEVEVDEEEDEDDDDQNSNDFNQSQIIEKSYSNLSKDSGVFADSYHSDYSNCAIGLGQVEESPTNKTTISKTTFAARKTLQKKFRTVNYGSNGENEESNSAEEDEEVDEEDDNADADEEDLSSPSSVVNDLPENLKYVKHGSNKNKFKRLQHEKISNNNELIWGSVTRLVESSYPNLNLDSKNKNNKSILPNCLSEKTSSNPSITIKNRSLNKPTKLANTNNSIIELQRKEKPLVSSSKNFKLNNFSLDLDLNSIDKNSMLSMIADYSSEHVKQKLSKHSDNNSSSSSSLSSSSPPSNTSNLNTNKSIINDDQSIVAKASPFIFNYNSLMNVSMLDNIQATNDNLDTMNSSILMFN